MTIADRILTIVVTATLTSAVWIIFGASWFDMAADRQEDRVALEEDPGGIETPVEDGQASSTDFAQAGDEGSAGLSRSDRDSVQNLIIPVEGIAANDLTDSFLDDRGGEGQRTHEAIDIMAPAGTNVIAAAGGTISKLHLSDRGGNSIYIRSPDRRRIHYYAHLREYAPDLSEGQRVRPGQVLGTVGSSGNADPQAPHLHFAILETTEDARWWEPANAINPYPLLRSGGGEPSE